MSNKVSNRALNEFNTSFKDAHTPQASPFHAVLCFWTYSSSLSLVYMRNPGVCASCVCVCVFWWKLCKLINTAWPWKPSLKTQQTSTGIVLQLQLLSHSCSRFSFPFIFSFTEMQDPQRKESLLLLQLTQSWRKSKLNFYLGCVCLFGKSPDYLHRQMQGINWCLGFWGAGYDRETRRDGELFEGHKTHIRKHSSQGLTELWLLGRQEKRKAERWALR